MIKLTFDLTYDIAETKNLAAAMPEKVIEMKALLEKLITEGRSTPGAKQPNDVAVNIDRPAKRGVLFANAHCRHLLRGR